MISVKYQRTPVSAITTFAAVYAANQQTEYFQWSDPHKKQAPEACCFISGMRLCYCDVFLFIRIHSHSFRRFKTAELHIFREKQTCIGVRNQGRQPAIWMIGVKEEILDKGDNCWEIYCGVILTVFVGFFYFSFISNK